MYDKVSFTTNDWKFVVTELEKHLLNARAQLENKTTNPEDTAFYRGRVALAKELLKLPENMENFLPPKGK